MMKNRTVTTYLDELALKGQYYFTLEEISKELSIKQSSVSVTLSRLAKKNKIQMIRKGFGIITGQTSGVLHPSYFLNAMMKHLGARYYVGLLNAAAYRGASHQAVMNYTVVADKMIKPISLKAMNIEFVTKNNFDEIKEIEKVGGIGGYFYISTPELTAIDILSFPKRSGHLNNIATVLEDLLDEIDIKKLADLCSKKSVPTSIIQRLGYLLDIVLGEKEKAKFIYEKMKERRPYKVALSKSKKNRDLSSVPFFEKWMIYENVIVEPD
jgi:predicted transcriptional regulator of viral defense system